MTENNFAQAPETQQHTAPVLTLHPEQEARQAVEKAVDMLDLSTDIDVMETMLRQDGLIDSGMKQQETAQAQATAQAQQRM